MLEMCRRDQWSVDDIDWSGRPREFSMEDEILVVQYFTDMALLELIAAELFCMHRDRAKDPTLRAIFETFVADEIRHSRVAERLAAHYDVHHYRRYHRNANLSAYARHFAVACRALSPEFASFYTTNGELILDVAMLRSIDDFVDDDTTRRAMQLVNRDESRHIAVDFYMVERYALQSDAERDSAPPMSWRQRAGALRAMLALVYYTAPCFREIMLRPLQRVDPGATRLQEALRRSQLLISKPHVAKRPIARYLHFLGDLRDHPVVWNWAGDFVSRAMGLDAGVMNLFYTRKEADELAREADEADELAIAAE